MNWEVALLLCDELEKDGMKVVMTKKSEGEFITNKDRAAIANESDADLFLRLHADAGKSTGLLFTIRARKGQFMELQGRRKTCGNHQRQLPTSFVQRSLRRSNINCATTALKETKTRLLAAGRGR